MTPIRLALLLALATAPALAQEPDLERGRELAERWCADCHLIGPLGPGGDAAPAFQRLAETRSDEALRAWIADPHPPMPKLDISAMAADDIAAYIRSLAACTVSC
jgi:mono/diheme cytochrome c family protein